MTAHASSRALWLLLLLGGAASASPEPLAARPLGEDPDAEVLGVTADGQFLVSCREWQWGPGGCDDATVRVVRNLATGAEERFQVDAFHSYGDAIEGLSPAQIEALHREERKPIQGDLQRWRSWSRAHPLVQFTGEPPPGVQVSARYLGCERWVVARADQELSFACVTIPGTVELRFGDVLAVRRLPGGDQPARLRFSPDRQWVAVELRGKDRHRSAILPGIPSVELLDAGRGASIGAAADLVAGAGLPIARRGRARTPRTQTEVFYLRPFEADARALAALLGVAGDRVKPLDWRAAGAIVIATAP